MRESSTNHASTLPDLLRARAATTPEAVAYVTEEEAGGQSTVSWAEFHSRVTVLASTLRGAGLRRGDRVGILAPNSLDWETAQMASLACGAAVAGFDPHYSDSQLDDLVASTRIAVLFAQDAAALGRLTAERRRQFGFSVVFRGSADPPGAAVFGLSELLRRAADPVEVDVAPEDSAILTFSSGTTGVPKAIGYTHAQVLTAVRAIVRAFPDVGADSRLLCWLPLANLFQRMIDFCAMDSGAVTHIIRDPREVMNHMSRARPHLFIGVPRFFERVHAAIQMRLDTAPGIVRASMQWAIRFGARRARRGGGSTNLADRTAWLFADALLARFRALFGGRARYLVSGSAPMPAWLLDWYEAVGLPVYEAYGVSENVVPVAMNRPRARRAGTVGLPLPPNEVKLGGDGEILVRGAGVFDGYLDAGVDSPHPDNAGYWATGDLGMLDADGYLSVTGRKSETFKTSTGRWVSPSRIEERLRRLPYVQHAVVLGAARKSVTALINVEASALDARTARGDVPRRVDETRSSGLTAALRADLAIACEGLAAQEWPAAVIVTAEPFTVAGGELTTNLKLRRTAIERKFAREIDATYAELEQGNVRGGNNSERLLVRYL